MSNQKLSATSNSLRPSCRARCRTAQLSPIFYIIRDLPPGPRGLPIIGSLFHLGPKGWETLSVMAKKYGNVFSLKLGVQQTVVLNDYDAVRDALVLQGEIFSGRPAMFVFDGVVKNRDVATSEGDVWREQRKFMMQSIKSFGFGKSASEGIIMDSVQMVLDDLDASKGAPIVFKYLFFLPIVNVIWKFSASHQLTKNDVASNKLCDTINHLYEGLGNQLINFLPMLRYVPGGFGYWSELENHKKVWEFLADEINAHRKNFKPSGEQTNFIDLYLQELHDRSGNTDAGKPPYNLDHMTGSMYDLFLGATDTGNNTLLWGFLLLATHPEIQSKVQDEMDKIIGRGRPPSFSDANRLPYLEALIQEVHRYTSLVPLSVFHSNMKETVFRGYRIPKGTTIIQNIHAIHHDPKYWKEPLQFMPERFLDANNRVIKPPYYMPFSVGPRSCPGELMARMELHLFFGTLLHKYTFTIPPGQKTPTLEPVVGITLAPQEYSLCVNER